MMEVFAKMSDELIQTIDTAKLKALEQGHSPLPWEYREGDYTTNVQDAKDWTVMNNETYYPVEVSKADMALAVRCVNLVAAPTDDPILLFARALLEGDPIATDAVKEILRR